MLVYHQNDVFWWNDAFVEIFENGLGIKHAHTS